MTINGKKYQVADSLKNLLNDTNSSALQGATISFENSNTTINKITALTLANKNGTQTNPLIIDGGGATIDGAVSVEGDFYEVKNLTVTGDFTITNAVQASFLSDNLTVKGKTLVSGQVSNQVATATMKKMAVSNPKTRIKIVFKDSTMAVIEIAKEDVNFTASGSTKVTTLSLQANANIFTDPDVIIPRVEITKGVTLVELNATIKDIVIDSNDEVAVTGKGNFDNVTVNTDKKVTLGTTGNVKNLDMKNAASTISIGGDVQVTNIAVPEGKKAEELVDNFAVVKKQIEKIENKDNADYVPTESTDDFFAAGFLEDKDRFGYIKLNIKNQGNYQVKYLLVDPSQPSKLPQKGEQVSAEAVTYHTGDEFIPWVGYDLYVYQVDENGKIIEVVKVNKLWVYPFKWTFNDNTLSLKIRLNPKDQSPAKIMNSIYIYNENQVEKITDFTANQWTQTDGIYGLTLSLAKKVDPLKAGLIFIETNRASTYSQFGDNKSNDAVELFALHDLAKDSNLNLRNQFYYVLSNIAYNNVEKQDAQGNKYYSHEPFAESDSVSIKAYKNELNQTTYQTVKDVQDMVKRVNEQLKDKVTAYKNAREKVYQLYVNDQYYDYPENEKLRKGLTQQDINQAKEAVNTISDEFTEKQMLNSTINYIEYLFNKYNK